MARPRLHDDALRARLLEVASAVVSTSGVGAVTVRDVATRAGTSSSAVYSLFGGRDELVRAVGDEAFTRFAAALASVPRSDDPGADLVALGLAYRSHALAEPHFYRVMFGTAGAGAQDPTRDESLDLATFGVLRDAVEAVLADLPAGTTRVDEVALGLWGLVHGLVDLELAGLLGGSLEELGERYHRTITAAGRGLLAG